MKKILYIFVLISINTIAQTKYFTKTGHVNFEASVPSFEEVAATNISVTAILNTENGEFAALTFVKAFKFKNALMEEHFNENYAESSEFPKATFKGKIANFDFQNIGNDPTEFSINGSLTFHGVTKALENIKIEIKKEQGNIVLTGKFITLASDYDIKIPKIVRSKLTDEVKVDLNFILEKK